MSSSWSTQSWSGLTLATGSPETTDHFYRLNGEINTSSVIMGEPLIIYRPLTTSNLTSSIGVRRQFTVTSSYSDIFKISHLGLTSRIDDTKYIAWSVDVL